MSYATDGKCHNANIGTFGHECGRPAVWLGVKKTGFMSGFCAKCKEHGDEAKACAQWVPLGGEPGNPFYGAHDTSLSKLSEHDWNVLRSRWSRGIDWNIGKVDKRWELMGEHFKAWPLYRTKKAAYEAMAEIILAESRWRSHQKWEAEQ